MISCETIDRCLEEYQREAEGAQSVGRSRVSISNAGVRLVEVTSRTSQKRAADSESTGRENHPLMKQKKGRQDTGLDDIIDLTVGTEA